MRARILAAAAAALFVVPTYAFSQRIRIPEIRVPEIKAPEIKAPEIKAPEIKVPAQPVDATLYPRWKDGVYSVISEESRLSVSSQAHLNKRCVSSTNGHVKPWELKPQQKDLMQVCVDRLNAQGETGH